MILMIDNYDSFTYNLVQYLGELGADIRVARNDQITVAEIERRSPEKIVISLGPCTPGEAGISCDVIRHLAGRVPLLGKCLGHQCSGAVISGEVVRCPALLHGKTSLIYHGGKSIFRGLPRPLEATRYHSLVIRRETLPDCLELSAETDDGVIMGVRHRELAIEGVQFHPESILTHEGKRLLANFLSLSPAARLATLQR